MPRNVAEFQTIYSEGGLLPPDLLRRLIDPKGDVPGLKAEDYGLPKGDRLNDAIAQSWNVLRRHWAEFRTEASKLSKEDPGTGLTNDKWTIPLLRELGFGMLPSGAGQLAGGRSYAISRMFGNTPVHLVGCGLSLDRRTAGARGAAVLNPHGLVQEFLNRKPESLWGIVSNGLEFRILRDSQALSRQSYLEFHLEAMFAGEIYSDFVVLWLTAHATRFQEREANKAENCWLEEWTRVAAKDGTRILGDLRQGVEKALETLGQGFVGHPQNHELRDALRTGFFTLPDFHAQLLRVVYRLIFLFVAEDRIVEGAPLLHPREESPEAVIARLRFASYYSTKRLRRIAADVRGSRHGDLWEQFGLLAEALSGHERFELTRRSLALPALGGFLWSPTSTSFVGGCVLSNGDFLEAIRRLAFTRQDRSLRPVDYRNLGAEELGGVYEGLLALTPQVGPDGRTFWFAELAGNERKTSGSYYTPDSLVQGLLDSALDPVVQQAIVGKKGAQAEQAILALKVCDPAVGSGHFLVGAAHRLARHLAQVRAINEGESQPSPLLYQHALRDVIGRCLYGVDLNPMAAELCRVSLWLEALEPGKPLSFLDHHIRIGNSLIGATAQLVQGGVPDSAFAAAGTDEPEACAELRQRNRAEKTSAGPLFAIEELELRARLRGVVEALDRLPDDRPEDIREKERLFAEFQNETIYRTNRNLADAWCSSFVISKHFEEVQGKTSAIGITQRDLDGIASGCPLMPSLESDVQGLTEEYQYFHWYLAFPEVFARGGFDIVLGNPPWEKINLRDEEYFATSHPEIASAPTKAKRKKMIDDLRLAEPDAHALYLRAQAHHDYTSHFFRHSGVYPLTGVSRINLFSAFAELGAVLVRQTGRLGMVLPSAVVTDDNSKALFDALVSSGRLVSVFDFENRRGVFQDVHRQYRFCLLTSSGAAGKTDAATFAFFLDDPLDISVSSQFQLTAEDIRRINPTTRTCPIFRSAREATVVKAIYRRVPAWCLHEARQDWPGFPRTPFNAANDSVHFLSDEVAREVLKVSEDCESLLWEGAVFSSLYEAKMTHSFDHRFATFVDRSSRTLLLDPHELSTEDHSDPLGNVSGRHWVSAALRDQRFPGSWFLAFRDVTNATNERTAIATILPQRPAGHSLSLILGLSPVNAAVMLANMNSFVFDFVARTAVAGLHLSHFVWKQLPFVDPRNLATENMKPFGEGEWNSEIMRRVIELTYTSSDMEGFARACGNSDAPFIWDDERRFLLRCELDALFILQYFRATTDGGWQRAEEETSQELESLRAAFASPRDAAEYILDAFSIARRRDEAKFQGDFRTKRVVLEIYDAMAEAIRSGRPYQTRLDPPPADPSCCHPDRA